MVDVDEDNDVPPSQPRKSFAGHSSQPTFALKLHNTDIHRFLVPTFLFLHGVRTTGYAPMPYPTQYDGCYIPQPDMTQYNNIQADMSFSSPRFSPTGDMFTSQHQPTEYDDMTQYNNIQADMSFLSPRFSPTGDMFTSQHQPMIDEVPSTPARPAFVPYDEEHSPSLPVQCENVIGKREIKPSQYHQDPWTMRKGRRYKGKAKAEDTSNTDEIAELYHAKRLPDFMALSVLYKWKVEPSFWGTLLGEENRGYLATEHIDAWSRYLLLSRQPTDRWTIMPSGWVERLGKEDDRYKDLKKYGDGTEKPYPKWCDVDRVFIAINITHTHWVTAVLDLRLWHLTIYDTMPLPSLQPSIHGSTNTVQNKLGAYLDRIKYFKRFKDKTFQCPNLVVGVHRNVPQQIGPLGDCGVFFCTFVEQLSQGQVVSCSDPTDHHPMLYRKRLADLLYATRVK